MQIVRYYDLGATQLAVAAERDVLLEGFERFLGERRQLEPVSCTFSVTIREDEPRQMPADAEVLYGGPLPDEGMCDFARAGQTYFMSFPGEARMTVDLRARTADIVVSPARPWRACGSMVPIVVEFALDLEDQHVVHAAGLSVPGKDGMVLVCAPSGTGKTTTALALAKHGLPFAADDIVVLRREKGVIRAWGLPRALHVHRNTAAMLPWLGLPPKWDDEGEQMVPRHRIGSAVVLENRELPVIQLVVLQRDDHTAIEPLDSTEMLAALAADNVRSSASGLTPLQQRRFAILADLARSASSNKVTIAPGLSSIEALAGWLIKG